MKKYDTFILKDDLNPVIKKGMRGVILEIYNHQAIEVEFVKSDGTNFEYKGSGTFCINSSLIILEETV